MADAYRFARDRFLLVGKIAKPHGLRGEVRIHSFSEEPETLLGYSRVVLVDDRGRQSPVLAVEKARMQGKAVILKLSSIDDRDDAEAIHSMGMLVLKEDLPALAENEYYWYQFEGLNVTMEDGTRLGRVKTIFSNGAQDIMVVANGKNEYLIPILDAIILERTEDEVIISPPPGLLEVNDGVEG